MFYNIIKNFFLKKNVTKRLATQNSLGSNDKVLTVGIIVDETYFSETNQLIERIVSQGILAENISVLVYKDKIKKKEEPNEPYLSLKNISLSGEIDKKEVNEFINTPFDLLINYYDVNKSGLLLLSTKSKAKFKVGFDTVDKRVNHFIIKTLVEDFNEFVLELFKYLKILNKI
jgi:hypothetical protein